MKKRFQLGYIAYEMKKSQFPNMQKFSLLIALGHFSDYKIKDITTKKERYF